MLVLLVYIVGMYKTEDDLISELFHTHISINQVVSMYTVSDVSTACILYVWYIRNRR